MTASPSAERILFLYLNTGGGHRSAARALAGRMNEKCTGVETFLLDGISPKSKFQRTVIENGYRVTGITHPWFWPGIYEFSKLRAMQDLYSVGMSYFSASHIAETIRTKKITRIVILHYLLSRPVSTALKMLDVKIPVTLVVTDPFSAHPMWFCRHRFPTVVFSELLKNAAVKKRYIPGDRLSVFPPILNQKYNTRPSTEEAGRIKDQLGFPRDRKVILVTFSWDFLGTGR